MNLGNNSAKSILCLVLCLTLALSAVPVLAFEEGTVDVVGSQEVDVLEGYTVDHIERVV